MSDNNKDATRKLCFHEKRMYGMQHVKDKIINNGYNPHNGYADEWLQEQNDKELLRNFVKSSKRNIWIALVSVCSAAISALAAVIALFLN